MYTQHDQVQFWAKGWLLLTFRLLTMTPGCSFISGVWTLLARSSRDTNQEFNAGSLAQAPRKSPNKRRWSWGISYTQKPSWISDWLKILLGDWKSTVWKEHHLPSLHVGLPLYFQAAWLDLIVIMLLTCFAKCRGKSCKDYERLTCYRLESSPETQFGVRIIIFSFELGIATT